MSDAKPDSPSAGALLRAAREKQGLHIAALAAAIKVSPRKLDALEHDRWDELPDATFTRALAQTVCRTLKIDARPVLDLLPAASPQALESNDGGLNAPFRDRPGRELPGMAASAVRPMVWGAAVLMAAAVVLYVLPADLWQRAAQVAGVSAEPPAAPVLVPAPAAPPAVAVVAAASAPMQAASSAPGPVEAPAASASGSGAALLPVVASMPAPVAAVATPIATPVAPPVTAPPVASPVAVATSAGLVQLRTSKASWIEVRDASGATLLSRTVLPGENLGLDGKLPIRMTIGNAAATQLAFRGEAVDLTPRTRDNVARVELQ